MTEVSPFLIGDLRHALTMRFERREPVESIDVGPGVLEAIIHAADSANRPLMAPPVQAGPVLFYGIPLNPRADMLADAWEIKP